MSADDGIILFYHWFGVYGGRKPKLESQHYGCVLDIINVQRFLLHGERNSHGNGWKLDWKLSWNFWFELQCFIPYIVANNKFTRERKRWSLSHDSRADFCQIGSEKA